MTDDETLKSFNHAMQEVYSRAKLEAGYTATHYLKMLHEIGGLGTAHLLLGGSTVSSGFTALWEKGRLDLTVENVVLRPEFQALFTDDELDNARSRLIDYGFDPDLPPVI